MTITKLPLGCYMPSTSNGKLTYPKKLHMYHRCVKETIFNVMRDGRGYG